MITFQLIKLGHRGRSLSGILLVAAGLPMASDAAAKSPPSKRFEANSPAQIRPTALYTMYDKLKVADPARDQRETAALGGPEAMQRMRASLAKRNADELAGDVIRGWEGILSTIVTVTFIQAMSRANPSAHLDLTKVQNVIHFPDGKTATVPVVQAHRVHEATFRLA